ncbi:hypothetical protein GGR53DRAFT_415050 [Hypoxylon sp. FL1150]|nr:hypothetical protein GGR53DRAFT_415050 [Hypoxylon sp. FL1150]
MWKRVTQLQVSCLLICLLCRPSVIETYMRLHIRCVLPTAQSLQFLFSPGCSFAARKNSAVLCAIPGAHLRRYTYLRYLRGLRRRLLMSRRNLDRAVPHPGSPG